MTCWNCDKKLDTSRKPGRSETCSNCGKYLHCCLNCRFYDISASKKCREPQAELVRDKEKSNYCDYFELGSGNRKSGGVLSNEEAKKKLNDLFKDD